MAGLNFAAAKAVQLSSVVAQSVKLERAGHEWRGCCPFHPDRSPSFTINDAKGFAHCFGCGWHGDAADFVVAIEGVDLREAVSRLGVGAFSTLSDGDPASRTARAQTADGARRIWREAQPIAGTPADVYLWRRGITMQLPRTLRFARLKHPAGGVHPCMVAAVFSPENALVGVQRTFLTEDGRKAALAPVKMSLGRISGSAIRLAPAAGELIVCEGAEDGLSLQQELGRAVWCSAGAAMLAAMQLPPIVRSVVIAADNDSAGQREAEKAAAVFADRGLAVRIMRPVEVAKDFNEQLTRLGSIEDPESDRG